MIDLRYRLARVFQLAPKTITNSTAEDVVVGSRAVPVLRQAQSSSVPVANGQALTLKTVTAEARVTSIGVSLVCSDLFAQSRLAVVAE